MISEDISKKAKQIDEIIESYLPKEEGLAKTVMEAMNYSIHAGGKRLRPMLMMETFAMFGGKDPEKALYPFMAAIEMIHTYSLCHDDLPAMDNDEYRRGRKSTHAQFGEAMGILAGDALLNYAFETALKAFERPGTAPCDSIPKALKVLAQKAGIYGMIGGQVVDVESEGKPESVTMDTIKFIHENKTAAMIESSLMIGGILAGAEDSDVKKLEQIGSDVGLAFQIMDDILDITGDSETLGKPVGSDEENGKVTYVSIAGLEQAKEDVASISTRAMDELEGIVGSANEHGIFLKELIASLTYRDR